MPLIELIIQNLNMGSFSIHYEGSGGFSFGGSSPSFQIFFEATTGQPGIIFGYYNNINPTLVSVEMFFDQNFGWNRHEDIIVDKEFIWNIGKPKLLWYRVEGKCKMPEGNAPIDTCNTGASSTTCSSPSGSGNSEDNTAPNLCCPQKFVTILTARTVSDLCKQLKNNDFNWPICRIQQFSRPADPAIIAEEESQGIDHSQNILTDVPFCQVPECIDLCIETSAMVKMAMRFFGGRFVVFSYTGSGGFIFGGSANYVSPSYTGSGGFVFGGDAITSASVFSYLGSGGFVFGGDALLSATSFSYIGSGGFVFGGDALVSISTLSYMGSGGFSFLNSAETFIKLIAIITGFSDIPPNFSAITFGGSALTGAQYDFHYIGSGGFVFGGDALLSATSFSYIGSGGFVFGGDALIISSNWSIQGSGGITFGGDYAIHYPTYFGSGGFVFGGDYGLSIVYIGDGGFVFGGESLTVSPDYHYDGSGGFVFGGSALCRSNFLGTFISEWAMEVTSLQETVEFSESSGEALTPPTALVSTACGCFNLPLILSLRHNLGETPKLKQFLLRNSKALPNIVSLVFSNRSRNWEFSSHLRGLGDDGISIERWDIVFEWACTNIIEGFDIGTNMWRFSILVNKNTGTLQHTDSKIYVIFGAQNICNVTGALDFGFIINTSTDFITVNNSNIIVNNNTLFDGVGLFNNPIWNRNPKLNINITQRELAPTQNTLLVPSIFPDTNFF